MMNPIQRSAQILFCCILLSCGNAAAMELPEDYPTARDKTAALYDADPDTAMARSETQRQQGNIAAATKALQEAFSARLPVDPWGGHPQKDKDSQFRRFEGNPYPTRNLAAKIDYRIEHNTRLLTKTPNNVGALENRGRLYLQQGQLEKAIQDFSRAIPLQEKFQRYEAQPPATVQDYLERGEFYLLAGNHKEALNYYGHALRLDPVAAEQFWTFYDRLQKSGHSYPANQSFIWTKEDARYLRGIAYEQKSEFTSAIADYTATMTSKKYNRHFNSNAHMARSRAYEKSGDAAAAIRDLTELIALEKQHKQQRQSYWERGMLYLRLQRLPEALGDFNTEIAQCSIPNNGYHDAIYYLSRGMVYEKRGESAKAAADFAQTAVLKANFYAQRGYAYRKAGMYTAAHHAYEEAIRLAPAAPEHYNGNGNVYLDEKDYQKAAAFYLQAIAADSGYGIAYGNAGLAYALLKQKDQALAYYQKQLDIGAAKEWVYAKRSKLHLASGDYPAALADTQRATAAHGRLAEAYYTQGKIYDRMQQSADSKASYEKAFAIDRLLRYKFQTDQSPHDAQAFLALGNAYTERYEYIKAFDAYDQALRLDPTAVKAYEARGDAYAVRREFQKAVDDYTQALTHTKPLPDYASFHLVRKRYDAYMELKQYEKAMADARALSEASDENHQYVAEIYDVLGDFDRAATAYKKGARYGSEVFDWDYSEP